MIFSVFSFEFQFTKAKSQVSLGFYTQKTKKGTYLMIFDDN